MLLHPHRLLSATAMAAAMVAAVSTATPVRADYVPWGTVLVPASAWAADSGVKGDLNVYSNGDGNEDQVGQYGLDYECVELAARWTQLAFGDNHDSWNVMYAYQMWTSGPYLHTPMLQHPNGGADGPQFGDLIIFDKTQYDPAGHVAVVAATGAGYVDIVEQNWGNFSPTGRARLPIDGTYMPPRWGLNILGWLRSVSAPNGWQGQAGPGGFDVDATGHVYPYGSENFISEQTVWPSAAVAKAVALIPGTASGYVMDNYGGMHNFGGAPRMRMVPGAYWFGQDMARDMVLTSSGKGGYILDKYGTLHPFGDAPALQPSATWNWDIARAMVLRNDGSGGWILDGYGGLHPFGNVPRIRLNSDYFPGDDVARGLCLRSDQVSGWWVDIHNVIHAFGGAPAVTSTAQFPNDDVARGITCVDDGGGYTITSWGRIRPFGDAPEVNVSTYFDNPVAAGIVGGPTK